MLIQIQNTLAEKYSTLNDSLFDNLYAYPLIEFKFNEVVTIIYLTEYYSNDKINKNMFIMLDRGAFFISISSEN